ncbi:MULTISPECIES: hypothetical protein [Aquimarina]|uniref:Uncharacterized protein n=1 Tax=Aquimarina algiphila TaxID=2047982 RepID=A0A554VDW8_9FLAO|nr:MULTISPECIES: hypothetical protein [Aquimarina]TSE05122.1 hypothetical protein FOF46_23775 [Aquimarina algiphila]
MNSIICKEPKTIPNKLFSIFIMIFAILSFWFEKSSLLTTVLFFCMGLIWLGYTKAFKITKDFMNEELYLFFGLIIWKSKLELKFPDYISVFNASFVHREEIDGDETRFKKWVVRFFKDNTHFTVLKLDDYNKALKIANDLGGLLQVEVYDTSKE